MIEYRITKYDPALRDASGAYTGDDWTSISDIGKSFAGVVLTEAEYLRVEHAYISATLAFLDEAGIPSLTVDELENPANLVLPVAEGSVVNLKQLAEVIRLILREKFWCRLEAAAGFLHFGYDYYLYLGVPHRCPAAERTAAELGLYVEVFDQP